MAWRLLCSPRETAAARVTENFMVFLEKRSGDDWKVA
jgi:hypothetical protein